MKVSSEPEARMKFRAWRSVELTSSVGSINKFLNLCKTDSGDCCLSSLRKNWQISSCACERERFCGELFTLSNLTQVDSFGRPTKLCSRLRTRACLVVS